MKKKLLTLLLVSFTTICLSQDVSYGVRGAINVSNLDFEPDADFNNQHRNGFAFGGFADLGLSENMSLLLELQWSAEGGKDEELRADYIHLPVLLRFSLSDRLMLGVGPKVSLKTWKSNDLFSTAAFSGVAGLEYMITDELFIDARMSYGVKNVIDQDFKQLEANNHVIQFGFGMKL
ncbi:porin family protein [Winogradskyella bathintestinalis]|uniref:Porin family protein n=1 Tax=Winogradskyella bathintestinalis TaxID=3035208 RepID=A0ABT7ZSV7_9FLAO|nr:porin family protein [Winogradskyella bathintestinalis]MDN3492080.1 porin family protein [Winogradskyella bathintestinalis]